MPAYLPSYLALVVIVSAAAVGCGGEDLMTPATPGSLEITTSTTGAGLDADGYSVQVDAGSNQAIGLTATLTIANVLPGNHTVQLSQVAATCTVAGDNPRAVSVTSGEKATIAFAVTCNEVPATGSIQVTTATTGAAPDPDGYMVSVDGAASHPIGVNATVLLQDLAIGPHVLTLSSIAGNCQLSGENQRAVDVLAGSTTVTFALNCVVNAPIAFTSNAPGLLGILVVNPDGTGLRNLTPAGELEQGPAWSPEGNRMLFSKDDDLYVMDADGGNRTRLVDADQGIYEYRWSADGRMIAYVDERREGEDGFIPELWVMKADGSSKARLAEWAYNFSWSPDTRIVYTSVANLSGVHLRIINADGSGDVRLTSRKAFQPAWSPDGTRIAFVTLGDKQMFLINPDGSAELDVTRGLSQDDGPHWSPDGSKIAFSTEATVGGIMVINRDGTGRTNLTSGPGPEFQADWSPDGSQLVFTRVEDDGNSEIYVMNADGSAPTNVTHRPNSQDATPAWGATGPGMVASRGAAAYSAWLRAHRLEGMRGLR